MMNTFTEFLLIISVVINAIVIICLYEFRRRLTNSFWKSYNSINVHAFEIMEDYERRCDKLVKNSEKKIHGLIEQARIKGKVSEKLAERAFTLSNNTALAIMHLQKTLAVRPPYTPRKKQVENEKIQSDINKVLGGSPNYSDYDMLYTILGDEERELVDKAQEHAAKYNMNGTESPKED